MPDNPIQRTATQEADVTHRSALKKASLALDEVSRASGSPVPAAASNHVWVSGRRGDPQAWFCSRPDLPRGHHGDDELLVVEDREQTIYRFLHRWSARLDMAGKRLLCGAHDRRSGPGGDYSSPFLSRGLSDWAARQHAAMPED
jgi:hypothetical protein